MNEALSRYTLLQYGILALPLAFIGLPLYIHAPDFYAAQAGLSLATIGTVLLLVRIFDAVQDPIIGMLSNKFSYLRPAIMVGAIIVMALGFLMLFHPPQSFTLLWFIISLVLTTTAFSVLSINFNALGSLWSTEPDEKVRITSWREAFGLIGLLIAAVLPSVFGLPLSSVIFVGLLIFCGVIFLFWNKKHRKIITRHEEGGSSLNFRVIGKPENIKFFAIYTTSMLASAIPAVLVLFFIRDRLDAETLTGLFLLLYFISGAVGMPLWQKVSRLTDKPTAWLSAMMIAIVTFIWAYFLEAGDIWQYAMICVFSGIALGAELALPPAILSNMIDEQDTREQTSLYFSVLAFLSKAALALGSFIAFFILEQASFVPVVDNSAEALQSLSFTYALLPCLIKLVAVYLLWRLYKNKGDINENLERNISHGTHRIS